MLIPITQIEAQVIIMALDNDDPPAEIKKIAEGIRDKIRAYELQQ